MAVVLPEAQGPETTRPRRALISRWLSIINSRPWLVMERTVEVSTMTSSEW